MKKACTIKSNFRRNNLANCLTPWTAGVPFWLCLVSGKTTQYVGRQEEDISAWPPARVTASPTPVPSSPLTYVLQCPWAQVTGCRNMPPLTAREFGPCLSVVEFGCLGPCSVTSFAPKSLYSPIGICQQLPALCLPYIRWITSHQVGAGIAINIGHLWKQPLGPK